MDGESHEQRSADGDRTTRAVPSGATHPDRIGPYRILAFIGEGAMGLVYEAEQERPHRRVALKIIKPGIASPAMLRRFQHEYEFLGRLQHPGVAQIHEAGVANTGSGPQPYFAMELVRGRRLDEYVRLKQPGLRARLALVAEIADAVQHAHHRGVIHRDLKPGNILITDAGSPKVLDFGLARAAQIEVQSTIQTMAGEVVGTMSYMSPEQVSGDVSDVDTRSDVYALGVILYELLAGRLPFDVGRKSLPEAVRVICEEEPARLGSTVRGMPADVETIAAKALEKDKLRRYESASALAGDIRHYLRDEPIVARPPSAAYQLRKFARRHRGLVGAAAAVVLALVLGVIVSSWQAIRASRAEQVAEARAADAQSEKAKAEAVTKFLTEMFTTANPSQAQGREVTVREVLDAAARQIDDGAMTGQPEVEVAVRNAIGSTYGALGLFEPAERQLRAALDRQSGPEAGRLLLADTNTRLAHVYYGAGRFREMEAAARESLRLRRDVLGEQHADVAASLDDLGAALYSLDQVAGASPLLRQALEIRRQVLPPDDPLLSMSLNNVAFIVKGEGSLAEAEAMFREALAIDRRRLGNEHPEVATKLVNVTIVLMDQEKAREAEPVAREAVEIRRRVLGNDHPALANALDQLSNTLAAQGRQADAEDAKREALAVARRAYGEAHRDTARLRNNLGWLLYAKGDYAEAEALFRRAVVDLEKTTGPIPELGQLAASGLAYSLYGLGDHAAAESAARKALAGRGTDAERRAAAPTLSVLGAALVAQRRFDEAVAVLREADGLFQKHNPTRTRWYRPDVQSTLGAALAGQRNFGDAEPLLVAGYEGLRDLPDTPQAHLRAALERLVAFSLASGRTNEAAAWRARLTALSAALPRQASAPER